MRSLRTTTKRIQGCAFLHAKNAVVMRRKDEEQILGTEGYIEVRKYADIAVKPQGNHLFLVDGKQARFIDCNNMPLPFGPQFVADIVNRTHRAQDPDECLLAAELSLKAQLSAKVVTLKE